MAKLKRKATKKKPATRSVLNTVLVEGTGTPYGVSFYETLINCTRKATLQEGAEVLPVGSDPRKKAADIGSSFHALAAPYHLGETLADAVRLESTPGAELPDQIVEAASRVFEQYRDLVKPDGFGKVISAEPRPHREIKVRGYPFTFREDLVTKTSKKLHRSSKTGLILTDHKCIAHLGDRNREYYTRHIRNALYRVAWEQFTGEQLSDVGVNLVSKTKMVDQVWLPSVYTRRQAKALWESFWDRVERAIMAGGDLPNPSACHHMTFGSCRFYGAECPGF